MTPFSSSNLYPFMLQNLLQRIWFFVLLISSLGTSLTKLILSQEEFLLFRKAGFPDAVTVSLGIIQLLGFIMLLVPKCRQYGVLLNLFGFIVTSVVLFYSERIFAASFLLLPVIVAVVLTLSPISNEEKD